MRSTKLWAAMLCVLPASVLAQTLTVTSPNGGEQWVLGTPHAITWTGTQLDGRKVVITLRQNNANVDAIAIDVPATNLSYTWTVGNLYQGGQAAPGAYQILVRIGVAITDTSNANFLILPVPPTPTPMPTLVPRLPTPPPGLSLQLPDLVVCAREKNYILVPGEGYVDVKVKNVGQASIAGSRLYFNISGRGTNWYDIPPLAPGQDHAVHRKEYYLTGGTETIIVRISRHVGSLESNVNNNERQVKLHRHYSYGLQQPLICSDGSNIGY